MVAQVLAPLQLGRLTCGWRSQGRSGAGEIGAAPADSPRDDTVGLSKSLREIEEQLPNGFHEARLSTVVLDFSANTARMELELWVGSMDAPPGAEREAYRKATLCLGGLIYFVIEPPDPDPRYEYTDYPVSLDAGKATDESDPHTQPRIRLPEGAFAHWFHVNDWNSFIHVAAREATLEWGEAVPHSPPG